MFTGIIEEIGKVKNIQRLKVGAEITVSCNKVIEGTNKGDSIALNGICLTVTAMKNAEIVFDLSGETLERSTISSWKNGKYINLERALMPTSRLGGHIVQGHIDTVSEVLEIKKTGEFYNLTISIPEDVRKYIVDKGSIAVDGISLTVASMNDRSFKITLIPESYQNTVVKYYQPGDKVNIEVDILAKYVENMLNNRDDAKKDGGLTLDKLKKYGY